MRSDNSIFGLSGGAGLSADGALSALMYLYDSRLHDAEAEAQRRQQRLMSDLAVMLRTMASILRMSAARDSANDAYQPRPMALDILADIFGMLQAMSALTDGQDEDSDGMDPTSWLLDQLLHSLLNRPDWSSGCGHGSSTRKGIHSGASDGGAEFRNKTARVDDSSSHAGGGLGHRQPPKPGKTNGDSGHPPTLAKGGTSSAAGSPPQVKNGKPVDPTGTVEVNQTIVVHKGEVFDGGGKLYKAGPKLGDGGQSENQKPVFVLEPGATLKNLQIQGADGVHCYGDALVDNVVWRDVGEDALTKKAPGDITVRNSAAFSAADKIFQLNAGGKFTLENFYAKDFGQGIRTNGGKQLDAQIFVRNSVFENGNVDVVRTDSHLTKVVMDNVTATNVKYEVLAPSASMVTGAKVAYKPYTG